MPGLRESGSSIPVKEALNVPSHEEDRPKIFDPGKSESNTIVSKISKSGIEVVAVRKGFYNQHRKKEGEKFIVSSIEKMGEWMRCVDPIMEKERQKFFGDKKKKAKR